MIGHHPSRACWAAAVALLLANLARADEPGPWEIGPDAWHRFEATAAFAVRDQAASVRVVLPQPASDSFQHIARWEDFPADQRRRRKTDVAGANPLLVSLFEAKPERPGRYGVRCWANLRSWRLRPERFEGPAPEWTEADKTATAPYRTLDEPTGAGRDDIAAFARNAAGAETHPLRIAAAVCDAVCGRLDYQLKLDFKGAARAFEERVGECGDYAALFVGGCRSVGVPARAVAGYFWDPGQNLWRLHVWAECYCPGIGWAPCDLAPADSQGLPGRAAVGRLPQGYLALSRGLKVKLGDIWAADPPLLQSYTWGYRGPERPVATWSVQGGPCPAPAP